MKKFLAFLSTFIVCFAFWELLVWSVDLRELILGAAVSAVIAIVTSRFFIHEKAFWLFNPVRIIALVIYAVFVFLWELIKANLSMAAIVLSPDLKNVKPGIIRIPAADKPKSLYGRAMVGNSITLTPGTITMDAAADDAGKHYYYIQWIDVTEKDRAKAGEIIKGRMERFIGRIWA